MTVGEAEALIWIIPIVIWVILGAAFYWDAVNKLNDNPDLDIPTVKHCLVLVLCGPIVWFFMCVFLLCVLMEGVKPAWVYLAKKVDDFLYREKSE